MKVQRSAVFTYSSPPTPLTLIIYYLLRGIPSHAVAFEFSSFFSILFVPLDTEDASEPELFKMEGSEGGQGTRYNWYCVWMIRNMKQFGDKDQVSFPLFSFFPSSSYKEKIVALEEQLRQVHEGKIQIITGLGGH